MAAQRHGKLSREGRFPLSRPCPRRILPRRQRARQGGAAPGRMGMTAAAIRRLSIPSPDELVERARALVPEIRELAEATEKNRNVFPHIIDKIRDAELLRTCRPKEFGGFEHDGQTALRIAMTISAACASTGWTVNGAVSNGRSLAHFPIEAQREVWSSDVDPFTCACFAPTGKAVPVDGGYILSGRWSFASGCDP